MDEPLSATAQTNEHDGWITAASALEIFSRSIGEIAAEEKLLALLQQGELQGHATLLLEEADVGDLNLAEEHWDNWGDDASPKRHPRQLDKSRVEIAVDDGPLIVVPADFFLAAHRWVIDLSRISWGVGVVAARRAAKFQLKLPSRPPKYLVDVPGLQDWVPPEDRPATKEADAFIRRAVKGLRFKKRDIDFFGVPAPVETDKRFDPITDYSQIAPRSITLELCLPADCEPVMDEFRLEIASGEFAAKYKNPMVFGVRAKIGRELVSRMMRKELGIPSRSTVQRKVARLVDEFNRSARSRSEPL